MMTDFLTSPNLDHPSIHHGFFTREGGVSEGDYTSLNVGLGSGDDQQRVKENRRRVAEALGSAHGDILTCYQTHSHVAHTIKNAPPASGGTTMEGDALVTNVPGLPIAVLTADCVPVLLADTKAGVIAAAHAGWKGAHAGIISSTIQAMQQLGAQPSNISAAIGPAIAQPSFEVGIEVKEKFTTLNPEFSQFFADGVDATHFQFDLTGLVAAQLASLGIANAQTLPYDTYADEKRFFSFRRNTHQSKQAYGRQCSVISIL